jgi:cytochrome P450
VKDKLNKLFGWLRGQGLRQDEIAPHRSAPVGSAEPVVCGNWLKLPLEVVLQADFWSPELRAQPYEFYERLHQFGSVFFMQKNKFWLIVGYEDAVAAARNSEVFSSRVPYAAEPFMVNNDEPAHGQLRQLITPCFSRLAVGALADCLRSNAGELLSGLEHGETIDIFEDFSLPFVSRSLGQLLGFSAEEMDEFCSLQSAQDIFDQKAYLPVITDFVGRLSLHRPGRQEGLCSKLSAFVDTGNLSLEQFRSLIRIVLLGGTYSTAITITNAIYFLLIDPSLFACLSGDRKLIASFIEEVLRLESPEQTLHRMATSDIELGGVRISKGDEIRICVAAANRDPKIFESPAVFKLERSPREHLAFGFGGHSCFGAVLARQEATAALETLLELPTRPQLDVSQLGYYASQHFRAAKGLRLFVSKVSGSECLG